MDDACMPPRRKKKRRAAATATLLPHDDAVLEILARVAEDDDLATLFRCAVACKCWRALVADPSFLRRRWPEGVRHPSSFLGLFGRPWRRPRARIDGPPAFVPAPRSPLDPGCRFPGSFGPCIPGLLNHAVPLASRQGLLLVRLMQPGRGEHRGTRLAVWDMFAGTCDMLPVLDGCEYFGINGSTILTNTDYCSNRRQNSSLSSYSASFNKVLIIGRDTSEYSLYTLSSAESGWSRLPMKFFRLLEPIAVASEGVVCRGKVYWLVWNSLSFFTFEFSIETGHICLMKLPMIKQRQHEPSFYNSPRLTITIDGKLSFLCLCWKSLKLRIWTCQGEKGSSDGALDWVHWLVSNNLSLYTFESNIETGRICLTKLPMIKQRQHELSFYNSPRLSVTVDGKLSFLCLRWKSLKLRIWTCQGEKGSSDSALDWVHTKIFELPKKTRGEGTEGSAYWLRRLECMCVGEKSGTLFVTGDRKLKYIVNIETGAIEEVPSQFWNLRKHNVVPFEMDWPAFFMSHLEAKRME
ncbi:unnamed protein product [Alopecurus aequalis]